MIYSNKTKKNGIKLWKKSIRKGKNMPKIGHLAAKISEEKKIGQFSIKKFFLIQKHFHCLNFLSQNFPQPFTQFLSPIYCFCTYFGANLGIRQKFLRTKSFKNIFQKLLQAMWSILENSNYRFLRVIPIYRTKKFWKLVIQKLNWPFQIYRLYYAFYDPRLTFKKI